MQGQPGLDERHQAEVEKTSLSGVPEGLVHVAQIQAVGLEGTVLLYGQDAEEEGESQDEKQTNGRW
jgi:hypothetical protein